MISEDDIPLLFPMFGVSIGMTFGTMQSYIPFSFTLVTWIALVLMLYKGVSAISFTMLGLAVGTMIGAFAAVVPFAYVEIAWILVFFVILNSGSEGGGISLSPGGMTGTRLIMMPLVLMVIGGIVYTAFPDFNQVVFSNGGQVFNADKTPFTAWQGCFITCTINPMTFLPSTIFAPLLQGDLIGFALSLFTKPQSALSFFTIAIGVVVTLIGLGVGGQLQALASGVSVNVNEQGTRLAQSIGITMLLFGFVNAFFGGWFSVLPSAWGLDFLTPILFASVIFYGGYLQGKQVI